MSIQAMNTSINNNRKLLNRRERFQNRLGGYNSEIKTEYNLPDADSKQLKNISKRIKTQEQYRLFKTVVVTLLLFLALVVLVSYMTDGIVELLTY